jgi:hypothetical protein
MSKKKTKTSRSGTKTPVYTSVAEDTVELKVSNKGCLADPFHRKQPKNVVVRVRHVGDAGVIVSGTADPVVARRALKIVGYKGSKRLAYRPYLKDGSSRSPGGDIVFFFEPGGQL